ncbi:MAG: S46 family peptidase, partial [Saprospiraceae bacterium]|nr:S46 family peptidase [Saprospiraceae bacterium]
MKLKLYFLLLLCLPSVMVHAQEKEASPFDLGRMWTFENPPKEWFSEAYNFNADEAWFDDVRKSSLRFATWCSASFVSENGLIMTNHHCSRGEAIKVQKEDENFDKNGFYASNLEDERKLEGLFVEQLLMVEDITEKVNAAIANAENDAQLLELRSAALQSIEEEYGSKTGWEGLRLQTVTFYSGGKFSIYGYKRYNDIRLVLLPENDLGFYGGDPDNFTFPRYNLDCTFWRAYDENGKPVDSSANYFEFNTDGVHEGTPVFVVGNPGRTERYRTVAQLEYDRDHRYKYLLKFITNRRDMLLDEYNMIKDDEGMVREAQEQLSTINNLSNSIKAYNGIMGGLHNESFMGRKAQLEKSIKAGSPGLNYWSELENEYAKLNPHAWAISHLGPSGLRGSTFLLMHELANYKNALENEASEEDKNAVK